MVNLAEILGQLTKRPVNPGYGEEVAQTNAFEQAPLLAQAITRYQKEQRAQPYASELQGLSGQYAKAPATQRPQVNATANALRQAYIQSGGSPIDLPKELWGSDPNQGFQTGLGQFTPGHAGDNLSIGQKQKLSGITGMYEGKPTWDRQHQQKSFDLQKTIADNNNIFKQLNFDVKKQTNTDNQLQKAKDNVYKTFDSLYNFDEYGSKTVPMDPKIKANLKAWYNDEITDLLRSPNPRETLNAARDDILKEYGDWTGSHILNALESTLGAYSPK